MSNGEHVVTVPASLSDPLLDHIYPLSILSVYIEIPKYIHPLQMACTYTTLRSRISGAHLWNSLESSGVYCQNATLKFPRLHARCANS